MECLVPAVRWITNSRLTFTDVDFVPLLWNVFDTFLRALDFYMKF